MYYSIVEYYGERQQRLPSVINHTHPVDCIVCGRAKQGLQGTTHHGWCWWCVQCYMTGRPYNSQGQPWHHVQSSHYV